MSTATRARGPLVDAEPVRRHVRELMAAGAGYARIAKAADVPVATVNHMLYTPGARPRTQRLTIKNAQRLLSVQFHHISTGLVDSTGSRRRIQALMAIGWPPRHLGPRLGLHEHYVSEIQRTPKTLASTAHALAVTYNDLWNKTPELHGVTPQAANRCRNYARANGWPPAAAWDDDTIDDPAALPEWTGFCGTDRGYWVHVQQKVPMCEACKAAHQQWIADRADIEPMLRNQAMFAARAAAGTRGTDIATDGRELIRLGCDYEQAAARLGITRQHLQQELCRHPETAREAA
ncbi:hypothetical protein ACGFZA_07535 [Streptomyces sp. NPDC048211]|uniref:hypothetical protein n=1 Tax=Streptomyces sp. NPDC048211 TaxID=3365516 RepID=UPI0037157C75